MDTGQKNPYITGKLSPWQYYVTSDDCLLEKFIKDLPEDERQKPLSISCPCKKCTPCSL